MAFAKALMLGATTGDLVLSTLAELVRTSGVATESMYDCNMRDAREDVEVTDVGGSTRMSTSALPVSIDDLTNDLGTGGTEGMS